MQYTVDSDSLEGICVVHVSGEYRRPDDSDELKRVTAGLHIEHGHRLFLFDMLDTEVVGGTMGAFHAGTPSPDVAATLRHVKVAFVRRKLSEDDLFFETVAVNTGFLLRAFEDIDVATAWLRKK